MLLQIALPVEADGAGDVTLVIGGRVDVDLEDPDVRVGRVLGEPIGLDEDVLWVCGHVCISFFLGTRAAARTRRARKRRRPASAPRPLRAA